MLRKIAYAVCRLFFREINLSGTPYVGPSAIWAANHTSAIVDPAVMFAVSPVALRPLAKHTLFSHPVMSPLLKASKSIPIKRMQDMKLDLGAQRQEEEKGTPAKEWRGSANSDAFRAVTEALLQGDNVLIFPEGISHDEPYLHKLKTGIARMSLQALTHAKESEFTCIIQPVAIDYSEKDEFRSDLNIHFCEPIAVTSNETDVEDIMLGVRNSLEEGLAQFANWDEKRNWRFLFEIAYGRHAHSGREFRAFVDRYRERFGAEDVFVARLQTMRRMLTAMSIEPFQMVWSESRSAVGAFYSVVIKHVWFHLLVSMPLQIFSVLLWYVPHRIAGYLAHLSTSDRDVLATMKIGHGIWVFPVWDLLLSVPLFLLMRVKFPELVDSTGNVVAYLSVVLIAPLFLFAGTWLAERRDFFPGFWKLARLRMFYPRAWQEVMSEWKDLSNGVAEKIQLTDDAERSQQNSFRNVS